MKAAVLSLAVFAVLLLLVAAVYAAYLLLFQERMLYFPQAYPPSVLEGLERRAEELRFRTDQGSQFAYYAPPQSGALSELWLLFEGNAGLALDWLSLLPDFAGPGRGFLLVEYPGFGRCAGAPAPETIQQNTEEAFDALKHRLDERGSPLPLSLSVMGLSLGTAAALQFSVRHPVEHIVLVAPFTSMSEMACLKVGRPFCLLLRHRFESEKWLERILKEQPLAKVDIFHGDADSLIPVQMARRLARLSPRIKYHELRGADHNDILSASSAGISEIFSAPALEPVLKPAAVRQKD